MRLTLPAKILPDAALWGFRPDFDDEAYLASKHSPRCAELFGDAAHRVADGRPLHQIVRGLCREFDIRQEFVWAKLIGETNFLSAKIPRGKGYKAPLGYDCPDGGRNPRPEFYGVVPNIRGGISQWRRYQDNWDLKLRMHGGMYVNVNPERVRAVTALVMPRTRAEAAYLIYTPHLYSLHDFVEILSREFPGILQEGKSMATKWRTEKQVAKIVAAARKFVDASIAGKSSVTIGQVTHEPRIGGRCSQFCREATEAGLGLAEHALDGVMFGPTARVTAGLLREAGYSLGDTSDLRPGDLLFRPSGAPGHIFMFMGRDVPGHEGVDIFAENTSSGSRGVPRRPGTKYTRRGKIVDGGIGPWTEAFRLTKPGVA